MNILSGLALVLSLGPSQGLAAPPQIPSISLPRDLQRVLTDYEAAWQKKDAEALANLFAEDGFVLPNGNPPIRGREAVRKFYAGAGGDLSLRALAYAAEGSTGYIIGGYRQRKGMPDEGKFTLTLRKDRGGKWLIVSDMDNGNSRRGGGN